MDAVCADHVARPAGTWSVMLAHAFVTGAEVSDSERDITAGVPSTQALVFVGVGGEQGEGGAVAYPGEQAQYGGGAVVRLKVRNERGQVRWGVKAVVQNGPGLGGESVDDAAERTGADVLGELGGVLVLVQGSTAASRRGLVSCSHR